jgi:ABC-2 type transport system permease protein
VKAFLALWRVSIVLSLREPVALFWNALAPAFLLVAFGSVFGEIPNAVGWLVAGLLCISAMGTALFGVATSIVNQRDQRVLRRYGATPIGAWPVLLAELATGATLALTASVIQLALAAALYGQRLLDRIAPLAAVLLTGVVAFMALGLVVGTLCSSQKTVIVAANAIFLPLLFIGGAAIPLPILPAAVARVSLLLPSRHLVDGLARILVRHAGWGELVVPLALMLATAVAGVAFSAALFRFDADERLAPRQRALAIATFVVLFSSAAFVRREEATPAFEPIAAAAPRAAAALLVDDFADGDLRSSAFGSWTVFTDRIPLLLGTSEARLAVDRLDDEPGRRALHVSGRVTRDARYGGFAGATLPLVDESGKATDLRPWRTLRLTLRGDGGSYRLVVATAPLTNFDHLGFSFDAPPQWRTIDVPLAALRQQGFGPPLEAGIERAIALQLLTSGAPIPSFDLWIARIELLP